MANEKTESLTKTTGTVPATIPDDLVRDSGRGTEQIGANDVRPPRLLVCQSGSPQRKPGNLKQIPGLQEMDLFNDLSNEIYGQGPLPFCVVSSLGHRNIQFRPMDEGGGVIDFDVPDDDPRAQFTTNEAGERVKPIATKFYDYLVWLPEQQELVVLSFKSTQIKSAIKLNGLLKLPLKIGGRVLLEPPAWARTYTLTTRMEQDSQYSWVGFNVATAGVTPQDVREICSTLADRYIGKNVIIEREDDIPVEAGTVASAPAGDDIPF